MRVSVIIPCRNERAHLGECLSSILACAWPHDDLELLVVDGESEDGTREIADHFARSHPCVRVIRNPHRTTPTALNIGLRQATGDVVLRMDAHVRYPPDYLPRLVQLLLTSGADNVGGCVRTVPAAATPVARAIARALSHPFGVGNSHFRIGGTAPRYVDTVPFGCYRRATLVALGGFDEELVRNQDDELNARLVRAGGRILLDPTIVAVYVGRARFAQLARMYFQYGLFKPLASLKARTVLTARQLVPAAALVVAFVLMLVSFRWPPALGFLAAGAGAYTLLSLVCATRAAWRDGVTGVLALSIAFGVLHGAYGWGYLRGLFLLLPGVRRQGTLTSLPLSR